MWNIFGAVVGAGLIIGAVWSYLYRRNIIKNKIEVEAKVVRLKKARDVGEGGRDYDPIFQYTVDGVQYERDYTTASDKHTTGFITTIYCHRRNPKKSLVPDQLKKMLVIDVIFLLCGIYLIYMAIIY